MSEIDKLIDKDIDSLTDEELYILSEYYESLQATKQIALEDSVSEIVHKEKDYRLRYNYEDITRQAHNHCVGMLKSKQPLNYITKRFDLVMSYMDNTTESGIRRYPLKMKEYVKGAYYSIIYEQVIMKKKVIPVQWIGGSPYEHTYTAETLKKKRINISNIGRRRFPLRDFPKEYVAYCYHDGTFFCTQKEWDEWGFGGDLFFLGRKAKYHYEHNNNGQFTEIVTPTKKKKRFIFKN